MSTATSVRQRPQAGFSLIELVVVIGLIGVMVAVAVPGIARYIRNYRIRGAASEVAGALQQARLRAITNNVNYGVLFVPLDNRTYRIVREDVQGQPISGARPDLSDLLDPANPDLVAQQSGALFELPRDVQFATAGQCPELSNAAPAFLPVGTQALRFNRLGAMCEAGSGATCPAVDAGAAFFWRRNDPTSPDLGMCMVEARTGLTRAVLIAPGGRVQVMLSPTEANQ